MAMSLSDLSRAFLVAGLENARGCFAETALATEEIPCAVSLARVGSSVRGTINRYVGYGELSRSTRSVALVPARIQG